jgi:DNA (cytosine-5)-methyltransferase 1
MATAARVRSRFVSELNAHARPQQAANGPNVVSLFSGGGGMDLGLHFAGFHTAFASDVFSDHCDTLTHNFGSTTVVRAIDVRELTGADVRRATGLRSIDIMAGGPPCQAFSILGSRKSVRDPRGALVYEYARLVAELKPRAFVFENVPGLLSVNRGRDWAELLQYFAEETGYTVQFRVLNAVDYGVPQMRRRVIAIGLRDGRKRFEFPIPSHGDSTLLSELLPFVTAGEALACVDGVANHVVRQHCARVADRYSRIAPGHRDRTDHTDRIDPCRPSGTVLVGSGAGGGRPFIHPEVPRHISVREAARLQSFPDWYVFQSTATWQYRAVGNAVPCLLAKAIGASLRRHLCI